ncbi:DUF2326 domain-containing protein [Mesorhizobium sp. CA18]|uniref:DUF2326 domain-containing protein n=1 Tax=unclassified Mesorhizobium TaxID=325217 RepID=UPI001CCC23C0|nr:MULTISPECIES: DUF2326 domain-containing protein [unclassified Mesorhizobium]MBZ9737164.1 DUF2326 domain-containing protein [Mesorhizobium sp. CA9]MBZ9826564.1 DUF2326 domain-containing protein [Mesorhizobium sp. CA18]MBZ9830791.1 DUF2326 domain-containing protein [Mesorhizobium sp. CA2]MBZ9835533.1 DUF2326 domain-containing protein [Mesorhizobium sp. CA3]MBZ9875783.1 DUF2326 domain-containing protein [Mesorhizobium sp. Ca11]
MITEVRSDLPDFRTAHFEPGMNIVLAEIAADSTEHESTNGLGKTTLIRIIHFCLGGSIARDRVLSHPALAGVSFGLTFTHEGRDIRVDRRTNEHTVLVSKAFFEGVDVEAISSDGDRSLITADDWLKLLSRRFVNDAYAPKLGKYAPSFRELFLYQARIGKEAYVDPLQAFSNQSGTQRRLVISYLLSLNWDKQRDLHEEQQKKDQIAKAIAALEEVTDSTDEQSIGDLEAERVVLEKQIATKRDEVAGFNVRQDYDALESRLNKVDRQIHDLVNDNHSDTRLLEYYERSAKDAPTSNPDQPLQILRDAGAIFKEEALRSLAEVAHFHAQIYRNRHDFLKAEIARLRNQIGARSRDIDALSLEKRDLLRTLQSSGALATLIELQRGLTDLEALHDSLVARIEERKRFDTRKDTLSASMIETRALLKRDLEDRRATTDEVIGLFADYTRFLYGKSGRLSIDVKQAGYSFGISIDREGSDGVDQMVVFCFDLAVATLRARRKAPFNILIHDSTMFADVDPRQYGLALQLAADKSEEEGFQYICCLNSGALPVEHLGAFELDGAVRLRLTDDGNKGRLLGKKLPPREKTE